MTRRRDLSIASDGLTLSGGAYVPDVSRGAVALLHGIPSTAPPDPNDEGYPGLAWRFSEHGWTAVWAEMRGVRNSPGYFTIEGWVRDCAAIIEQARKLLEAQGPVAVVGSSAGGCVAVEAIARGAHVDALALLAAPAAWMSFADDPAAAVRRVTQEAGMPLAPDVLEDPAAWAGEFERVVTEASIARLSFPILVVHGTADDVVPVDHADRIARAAVNTEVKIVEGGLHQLRRDDEAIRLVLDWLDETLA